VTDPWGNPLPERPTAPIPPPDGGAPGAWWPGGPAGPDPEGPTPGGPYGAGPPARVEGMANGALVAGVLSLMCGLLGVGSLLVGPIAVLVGLFARRRIDASGGALTGRNRAVAGLVLGIVGTLISLVWLFVVIANPDLVQDLIDRLDTTTTTVPG
jgi:hypothetical protein